MLFKKKNNQALNRPKLWILFTKSFGGRQFFLLGHWFPSFVLDFWWRPLWVSLHAYNGFLWFTSGATPADLLTASIAVEPFWLLYLCTYIQVLAGVESECRIYDPTENEDSHLCLNIFSPEQKRAKLISPNWHPLVTSCE